MEIVELNAKRRVEPRGPSFNSDVLLELGCAVGPDHCREIVEDSMLLITERLISIDHSLRRRDMTRIQRLADEVAAAAARVGLGAVAAQATALGDCARRADATACAAVGHRLLKTGEACLMAHHDGCVG